MIDKLIEYCKEKELRLVLDFASSPNRVEVRDCHGDLVASANLLPIGGMQFAVENVLSQLWEDDNPVELRGVWQD